jgi:hypothetical protein
MRGRNLQNGNGIGRLLLVVFVVMGAGSAQAANGDNGVNKRVDKPVAAGACQRAVVEGEVRAGESFARPIGGGLEVRLEALSWGSGWLLRVLPVAGPRPAHDYAELATPPYASVSPLLLSTDFSFRAQDAVAWNPRRFQFAASSAEFAKISAAFERYRKVTPPTVAAEGDLAATVSEAPEGMLQILDARLIPGTANQSRMAAMVASHFSTTAHTVEEPAEGSGSGKGMPLGKLTWVRFRVSLDLPRGFRADRGLLLERHKCP